MRDRGSTMLTTLLVSSALLAAIVSAMVPVLGDLTDRQRARSAADAAALAGVHGGRTASAEMAAANGAALVSWRRVGRDVIVEVGVGEQVVGARATDAP